MGPQQILNFVIVTLLHFRLCSCVCILCFYTAYMSYLWWHRALNSTHFRNRNGILKSKRKILKHERHSEIETTNSEKETAF